MHRSLFVASLCAAFLAPALASEPPALVGHWVLEKENFVAKARMYTSFGGDGRCTQVAKASIVGTTHWVTSQCAWTLADKVLSMKVTASATHPDKVTADVARATVESVSATELVITTQEGEKQAWARADVIPPEYAARLAAEVEARK